jgi:His/Glu/Gln/Arg/opine family amino acid ABC transporter permease subunit
VNEHLRFDLDFVLRHLPDFGPALVTALEILVLAAALAFVWGTVLAVARLARGPVYWAATAYIELFRNTPLLIQIYFAFFGLPAMGIYLSAFATGVLALAAQHGAFFAEILRGTIQSIQKEQREAGLALGMLPSQAMRYVILPQAVRNAIPATGNQLVLLLQDTALVSTIGVYEITLQGRTLAERSAASFEMFVAVGAIYLLLSALMSVALRGIEGAYRVGR